MYPAPVITVFNDVDRSLPLPHKASCLVFICGGNNIYFNQNSNIMQRSNAIKFKRSWVIT